VCLWGFVRRLHLIKILVKTSHSNLVSLRALAFTQDGRGDPVKAGQDLFVQGRWQSGIMAISFEKNRSQIVAVCLHREKKLKMKSIKCKRLERSAPACGQDRKSVF